jgi:hypothetical protein
VLLATRLAAAPMAPHQVAARRLALPSGAHALVAQTSVALLRLKVPRPYKRHPAAGGHGGR